MNGQIENVRTRRERGIALLVCIFALTLLSGIGIGLMYMADAETMVNANYRDSQQAYFAAYAGLQEVRERLMPGAPDAINTAALLRVPPTTTDATSVVYVMNASAGETVAPWTNGNKFQDIQICHEGFPNLIADSGVGVPCSAPGGAFTTVASNYQGNATKALGYRWVRVTLKTNGSNAPYYVVGSPSANQKPICWDGLQQLRLPDSGYGPAPGHCDTPPTDPTLPPLMPVYRLTSLAMAPGGSRRMMQMEVANDPPIWTNAAVDSKEHVSLNGKLDINGFDACSCNVNACTTDSFGNTVCPSLPGKFCDNSKWAIYSHTSVDSPNPSETLLSGHNPPYVQNQPWPFDIAAMVQKYKGMSGTVNVTNAPYSYACTGTPPNGSCGTHSGASFGVSPTLPTPDPNNPGAMTQQVTYVPGDLQITGNSQGAGILIVDGDLDVHGGLQFYGLILVQGVIQFSGGGSDKTNIQGAVLAGKQSLDNSTNSDVLGGSAVIQYDGCSLKKTTQVGPPTLIMTHEINF